MGAWGFFDDQNDNIHDYWYDLEVKFKNITDVAEITKILYDHITSNNFKP